MRRSATSFYKRLVILLLFEDKLLARSNFGGRGTGAAGGGFVVTVKFSGFEVGERSVLSLVSDPSNAGLGWKACIP